MSATGLALGASRTACFVAVSLVLGGLVFAARVWVPALRESAGEEPPDDAFARRFGALVLAGCGLGFAGTLGLMVAGDGTSGSGFWLAVQSVGWVAVAGLLLSRGAPSERLEPEAPLWLACGTASLALVLAGRPTSLGIGLVTIVHVAAAAVWVGGIACLVVALPVALRPLDPARRTALMLAALARFSPYAFAAVIAIVLSGTVHAATVLPSFADLWESAFGRLVLLKVVLVLALIGLGAINRNHVIPALLGEGRRPRDPLTVAVLSRRVLAWEAVAMAAVLVASAALVAADPSSKKPDPYPVSHVDTRRSAPDGAVGDRGR
jgi:copper transport protein